MVSPVKSIAEPLAVTIAEDASLTAAINMQGRVLCGVEIPGTWTAANLTFQASQDGTNFFNMHKYDAGELTVTAAASLYLAIDPTNFLGVNFLKVRSGTTGTPVNQAAERSLTLMLGKPSE